MANHLNLRDAYLERDVQGNAIIFSNGLSARLPVSEVRQLVSWLTMNKDEQPSQLHGPRNAFKLINGTLFINDKIRIRSIDVQQMGKWLCEDNNWLRGSGSHDD